MVIDWKFATKVVESETNPQRPKNDEDYMFEFKAEDFEDAVVMPAYRNIDQPQYFYVAEIRSDLNPVSPFPSPELYKTFAEYYASKYGLAISNLEQPLLDVDHTSARLNLLIPRYMNQKGVLLPTSSAETKKARRENLQQKQILVPELCDVHVFLASLWRKAVCLPAILYRLNYLLLAEEIRKHVSKETQIGIVELPEGFRFPKLDFGIDTSPENLQNIRENEEDAENGQESKNDDSANSSNNDDDELQINADGNDKQATTVNSCEDNSVKPLEPCKAEVLADSLHCKCYLSDANPCSARSCKCNNPASVDTGPAKHHCDTDDTSDNTSTTFLENNSHTSNTTADIGEVVDVRDQNGEVSERWGNGDVGHVSEKVVNGSDNCIDLMQKGNDDFKSAERKRLISSSEPMNSVKNGFIHATNGDSCHDNGKDNKADVISNEQDVDITDTDVFANVDTYMTEKERRCLELPPEPLIPLDMDMNLEDFIGPSPCELLQALTMSNANDFFSLERLETIGDSFLKYAITVYLYCSYPGIHEGKLSYLRSKQVSNFNLYRLGKKKGLAECMISTKFEPYENWLPPGYVINEDKRKGPVPKVHLVPVFNQNGTQGGPQPSDKSMMNATSESTRDGVQVTMPVSGLPNCSMFPGIPKDGTSKDPPSIKEPTSTVSSSFQWCLEEMDLISAAQDEEEMTMEVDPTSEAGLLPYCLQIHHCLPDKAIADCVEALIGCYLTSCDKIAALKFMSWMGLKVLPAEALQTGPGQASLVRPTLLYSHFFYPICLFVEQ